MLKYQLNINSVKGELKRLDISSFSTMDVPFVGDGKMMLTCYVNERNLVHENDMIVVVYDVDVQNYADNHKASTVVNYKVNSVNDENLSFTLIYDKYVDLDASFARTETFRQYNYNGETEDIEYIIIYFSTFHHFQVEDTDSNITVYLSDNVTNATTQFIRMQGQVVDNRTLRFLKNENMEAYERLFYTDLEMQRNYSSMTYFKLLQENYMFKTDFDGYLPNTTFYQENALATISLPLTNTFSTELFNSINVDGFVKQQVEMSLNKAAENEKDIYYPVSMLGDESTPIRRIKFNFHFRRREINNIDKVWSVHKEWSWNGVKVDGNNITLPNEFFSYISPDNQSDLLTYLGFTDSDVKFRKNILKKSFARLLFYDSTDEFKQKLLAYSTVFFDTGALLNKYMRNIEKDRLGCGYITYNQDGNNDNLLVVDGIKVNRELNVRSRIEDDDVEDCRLSSQMIVSDKFSSSNSSEGFYLYLWKDNVSVIPLDIYMRVEFNHAKYGRVVPFMMPYGNNGIKTFKEIATECYDGDYNKGYTLEEYRKYSYIHFKYKRDNELGHIYYLDPETYGNGAGADEDTLILNLYEANVV